MGKESDGGGKEREPEDSLDAGDACGRAAVGLLDDDFIVDDFGVGALGGDFVWVG